MNQTSLIRLTLSFAFATTLTACNKPVTPAAPQEITAGTSCSLDGMTLADFPGPKAVSYTHLDVYKRQKQHRCR